MPHRFVPWRRAVVWNQSRVEDAPNAAPDYESGGQEFESLRARQKSSICCADMSLWKRSGDSQETLHARRPFKCDADVVKLARESAVAQLYSPSCSLFLAQLFSTHDAHLSAPATVDWMARVQRPAIQADIGAETARLDESLRCRGIACRATGTGRARIC